MKAIYPISTAQTVTTSQKRGEALNLNPPGYYTLESWLDDQVDVGARASLELIRIEGKLQTTWPLPDISFLCLFVSRNTGHSSGFVGSAGWELTEALRSYCTSSPADEFATQAMSLIGPLERTTMTGVDTAWEVEQRISATLPIPQKWRDELGIGVSEEDKPAEGLHSQLVLFCVHADLMSIGKVYQWNGHLELRYNTGKQSPYAIQSLLEGVD